MPGQGSEGQGPSLSDKHSGLRSGREEAKSRPAASFPHTQLACPLFKATSRAPPPPGGAGGY